MLADSKFVRSSGVSMDKKQSDSTCESGAPKTSIFRKAGISRREFARRAVLATASAAALPAGLLDAAPDLPRGAKIDSRNNFESGQGKLQGPPPASNVSANEIEVENKFESILSQYGSRFSEEQKADIRRLVGEMQKPLDRLRAFSLDNSDQPATVLKPLMDRKPQVPDGVPAHARHQGSGSGPTEKGVGRAPAKGAVPVKPRKHSK